MSVAGRRRAALLAARTRRIQLDVDRAAQERRIDAATAGVLLVQDELEEALAAAERVRVDLGRALQALLAEVGLDRTAALSGLPVPRVRSLTRLARRAAAADVDVGGRGDAGGDGSHPGIAVTATVTAT